jgi:serine/threonine protein kinase
MAQKMIADRYILQISLGRGAFGQVWQAEDTTLGRQVAVKVVDLTAINYAPQLADIVAASSAKPWQWVGCGTGIS